MTASVWDDVVGQGPAIAQLDAAIAAGPLHAYLFLGPAGSTKDEAARAFAALLLTGVDDPDHRDAHLALRGEHPDVREVRRTGARIDVEPAKYIAEKAALSPIESAHKVLILHEFHLLTPDGAAILLKTIEEPPPSTTFIILADDAPAELETIWSRSVTVRFTSIPEQVVTARLVAESVGPGVAKASAAMAYGDLDRARLLATDPAVADRRTAFTGAPQRLDGTGNTALTLTAEILELIDDAAEPLKQKHAEELQALEDRVEQLGERGAETDPTLVVLEELLQALHDDDEGTDHRRDHHRSFEHGHDRDRRGEHDRDDAHRLVALLGDPRLLVEVGDLAPQVVHHRWIGRTVPHPKSEARIESRSVHGGRPPRCAHRPGETRRAPREKVVRLPRILAP